MTRIPLLKPAGHSASPGGPSGPAGPVGPVATSIVTVRVGVCVPIPNAVELRKPAPAASVIAAASSAYLLALRRSVTAYLDPFQQGTFELLDSAFAVGLRRFACAFHEPGCGQHARDPGEESSDRGDLFCGQVTAPLHGRTRSRRRSSTGRGASPVRRLTGSTWRCSLRSF